MNDYKQMCLLKTILVQRYVDVDVTEIQQKAVDKLRIITTLVEQCIEKQTLQAINAQLDTTIGLIKYPCNLQ